MAGRSSAAAERGSPDGLVAFERVEKRYRNGTLALGGVDLEVRGPEFLSLLGPSGCGKSTVLRLLAGLTEPTAGRIAWNGQARGMRPAEGGLGFVFQEPTLMPWARVLANIMLPLSLKRLPRGERLARAREAVRLVGLEGFERAFPRELSGGMRMRVSIARALVTRPRLLLMDEPFAALDEITRQRLNDDLLALWQRHRFTVVFVTHSVYESVYLSSRILVMTPRPGRIAGEVEIPAPYPRGAGFRLTPAYAALCGEVSAVLGRAITA